MRVEDMIRGPNVDWAARVQEKVEESSSAGISVDNERASLVYTAVRLVPTPPASYVEKVVNGPAPGG
jgi:hypothetical protein